MCKNNFYKKFILSLLVIGICISSISAKSYANDYFDTDEPDYRYWNQINYRNIDSSFIWLCPVVAEAKLLYAAGIDRSSSFNPVTWRNWKGSKYNKWDRWLVWKWRSFRSIC